MKKMRNSKRGFTLTELIVVVAIVVIVASAAFVGVAITLENAKRQQDLINDTHGRDPTGKDLFEKDAWVEIDKWTKNAAQLLDIHYHTPQDDTNDDDTNDDDTNTDDPNPVIPNQPNGDNPDDKVTGEGDKVTGEGDKVTGDGDKVTGEGDTVTDNNDPVDTDVTVKNAITTKRGSSVAGVVGYTINGRTMTVTLYAGNSNTDDSSITTITVTKQDNGNFLVDFSPAGNKYWICSDKCNLTAEDYYNNKKTKVYTASELGRLLKMELS